MFKDFVPDCFVAQICANSGTHILAHICVTNQSRTKSFSTNIGTIPKNMPTNFELKRLEPKLDIVEKPENRVHKLTVLTDSNGAQVIKLSRQPLYSAAAVTFMLRSFDHS